MATLNLQAILTAAAAKATARAARAIKERTPRAPGLHARFLRDLLVQAPTEGAELPLTDTVTAWVEAARAAGEDLGTGKTPEASITARLYTAEAGGLPSRISIRKGRPATLVIAPDTVPTTQAGAEAEAAERERIEAEAAQTAPAPAEAPEGQEVGETHAEWEARACADAQADAQAQPAPRHGRGRRHG